MIKNIGKYAEYLVLTELLKRNAEAYLAITLQQDDYDLTVILSGNLVVRVQVKATELQNDSTNNSIDRIDKKFDCLVLVVVDGDNHRFFILSKQEVEHEKAPTSQHLYISRKEGNRYFVKGNIASYENKWEKIIAAQVSES